MRTIEIDEEVYRALQKRARAFEDTPNDVLREILLPFPEAPPQPRLASEGRSTTEGNHGLKMQGEEIRRGYVSYLEQKGIALTHEWGVLYSGANGLKVAIPTATERRSGRWFLGVAESYFGGGDKVVLILLCLEEDQTFDFVLPHEVAIETMRFLTRLQGQIKMNVVQAGESRYILQIPQQEPMDVSLYLHAYGPLRGKA